MDISYSHLLKLILAKMQKFGFTKVVENLQ